MRTDRTHKALERAVKLAETPMPEDVRQRVRAATMASVRSALPRVAARPVIRLVRMAALAALAVALFGGTAYAVMRSAPGDVLYPIREAASKVGVGQVPLEPPAEEPIERKLAPVVPVPPATDAEDSGYREGKDADDRDPAEPKEGADPVEPADESEPTEPRGRRGPQGEPKEHEPQGSEDSDSYEENSGRRSGSGLASDEEQRERPVHEYEAYYGDR